VLEYFFQKNGHWNIIKQENSSFLKSWYEFNFLLKKSLNVCIIEKNKEWFFGGQNMNKVWNIKVEIL